MLVETGIGERRRRQDPRDARPTRGPWIVAALETAGFLPETVNVVAMSHLHFDHAGGLLRADGERAFPHATIVAQKAEWEIALGDNPRLVASYVQPELRLVAGLGRAGLGRRRARAAARRDSSSRPGATPRVTRRSSCAAPATAPGRSGFLGDLFMRPWAREPALGDRVRRLPAGFGRPQGRAVRAGRRRGLDDRALARARHPIGRLVRDRDRFRFEPE